MSGTKQGIKTRNMSASKQGIKNKKYVWLNTGNQNCIMAIYFIGGRKLNLEKHT
jgi:hypothetical protein